MKDEKDKGLAATFPGEGGTDSGAVVAQFCEDCRHCQRSPWWDLHLNRLEFAKCLASPYENPPRDGNRYLRRRDFQVPEKRSYYYCETVRAHNPRPNICPLYEPKAVHGENS